MSWDEPRPSGACAQCGKPGQQFTQRGAFYVRCLNCIIRMFMEEDDEYLASAQRCVANVYRAQYNLLRTSRRMFEALSYVLGFMIAEQHPDVPKVRSHMQDLSRIIDSEARAVRRLEECAAAQNGRAAHQIMVEYRAERDLRAEASAQFSRANNALLEQLMSEKGVEWPAKASDGDPNATADMLTVALTKKKGDVT